MKNKLRYTNVCSVTAGDTVGLGGSNTCLSVCCISTEVPCLRSIAVSKSCCKSVVFSIEGICGDGVHIDSDIAVCSTSCKVNVLGDTVNDNLKIVLAALNSYKIEISSLAESSGSAKVVIVGGVELSGKEHVLTLSCVEEVKLVSSVCYGIGNSIDYVAGLSIYCDSEGLSYRSHIADCSACSKSYNLLSILNGNSKLAVLNNCTSIVRGPVDNNVVVDLTCGNKIDYGINLNVLNNLKAVKLVLNLLCVGTLYCLEAGERILAVGNNVEVAVKACRDTGDGCGRALVSIELCDKCLSISVAHAVVLGVRNTHVGLNAVK